MFFASSAFDASQNNSLDEIALQEWIDANDWNHGHDDLSAFCTAGCDLCKQLCGLLGDIGVIKGLNDWIRPLNHSFQCATIVNNRIVATEGIEIGRYNRHST